jgi:hypothetical protein
VALYAELEDPKYERAAIRWLVRLAAEKQGPGLHDLQLAVAALEAMSSRSELAVRVLAEMAK